MNRQRRQEARKKQRERELRAARQRRLDLDRCAALIMEADWAGQAGDLGEARRLLERALRIHPRSHGAHERLADLAFRSGRPADGLGHYDQLTRPPEWPPLIHMAAAAAYKLARYDQAADFAQLFIRTARGVPEWKPLVATARQLAGNCRILRRRARSDGRQPLPDSPPAAAQTGATAAVVQQTAFAFEHATARSARGKGRTPGSLTASTALRARTTAKGRVDDAPAAEARRPESGPPVDTLLPPFPAASLPDLSVQFEADGEVFLAGIGGLGPLADVLLRRDFAALQLQKGFDELISLASVEGVEHFWYQHETVRRLLRDFRGRVLLADEVGLGKTIEACLALKEYWLRGLVSKALILTPASLVGQWVDELTSKFGLAVRPAERGGVTSDHDLWDREPIVVASLPLVRQRAYRARLASIDYDLVIVDEAHVLGNRASAAWQLVNDLKKRFLLLLSATPVGNDLSELYNLILLLRPGLLKTEAEFRSSFGGLEALAEPERRGRLRALLREVMIRNTRAHIDVRLPRRLAATEIVAPTPAEALL